MWGSITLIIKYISETEYIEIMIVWRQEENLGCLNVIVLSLRKLKIQGRQFLYYMSIKALTS